MNAARKSLLQSWKRKQQQDPTGYTGTDGVHGYDVTQFGRVWRVVVDGAPLRSRSHNVIRSFETEHSACWHAELEAERRDVERTREARS